MGNNSFASLFPRVYQLSNLKEALVAAYFSSSKSTWNLHMQRNPFEWEVEEVSSLIQLEIVLMDNMDNTSIWIGDGTWTFSCKSF